jgi:AraC family transcriptional regulator
MAAGEIGNKYFGGTPLFFQTYANIRLAEVEYKTAKTCAEHRHEPAFFSLLLQGRYTEVRGNERMHYGALDLGFHPKETVHSDAIEAGPARFFLIEIPDSWTEHVRGQSPMVRPQLQLCDPPAGWLAARLYREHCETTLHCPLVVEGMVSQLLSSLAPEPMVVAGTRPRWLARVIDLLQTEFQSKVTLQQLADEVDLHPVYLSRAFRRYRGESLGLFVSRLRVQFAQKKICDPAISLVEVALLAGFSDQSQFTRIFRRHTGFTPGAFRKIAVLPVSTTARAEISFSSVSKKHSSFHRKRLSPCQTTAPVPSRQLVTK